MTESGRESRLQRFEGDAVAHIDVLIRAAVRILRSTMEAEDVVQETYLRAWKHFDSFETGTNCRAWLFRIMFNVIKGRAGKKAKRAESSLEEEENFCDQKTNVVAFDPLKHIEAREVLEATRFLSDEHRSILWLVVVEEFSYLEAAEILQVPVGTVMSRLHRSRCELRKRLATPQSGSQTMA